MLKLKKMRNVILLTIFFVIIIIYLFIFTNPNIYYKTVDFIRNYLFYHR